jgi:hypothetical protein
MRESRNIFDLLGKIDWEGGIASVLEYGLQDIEEYDVPEVLKDAWADMADVYAEFELAQEAVADLLHKAEYRYNEEKDY